MSHSRVARRTFASDAYSLASHVLSLPRPSDVDSLVVLQGEGENWRVEDAARIARLQCVPYLLVAASNGDKDHKYTVSELQNFPYVLHPTTSIVIGKHAANTLEQAQWFLKQVKRYRIRSATVCASPYHVVRAYLTFLKHLLKNQCQIPLFALPTSISPAEIVPESQMTSWELVPGEVKRIGIYQTKGDVATLHELEEYLGWLWRQPILSTRNTRNI